MGLREIVERTRKAWALRRYVRVVGPRLLRDYGVATEYSVGRVATAIAATRSTKRYAAHAYAMFCSLDDFVEWLAKVDRETNVATAAALDSSPYRAVSPAATATFASDDAAIYGARRDRYHALRREAADANEGRDTFMPPTDGPPWTMHDSGVEPRA